MIALTPRGRLPNRRAHELIDFTHGGFRFTAGLGRHADGTLAEVFLNADKVGTAIETTARDAAILASMALQHGATLDELRKALTRNSDGSASGALGELLDLLHECEP
jgi:hypothetical protein